ncbi:DUF655 domain-containing protein [Candidatus Woesearchaeota archaeon]|nr:DUF655 domain-containing protein [Candidatus Woesearchaeota archaeon]
MQQMQERAREENAIILDFLPNGYPFDKTPSHRKTAIAQAIGEEYFSLLELVPKKDVHLKQNQRVYIGDGKRDEIHHINGRLDINRLTQTARAEMEFVINELVDKSQTRFVDFFNNSQPLSTRMHQLELLPGLGKKHMWEIIEERKGDSFKDFEDIKKRVKLMPDPKKIVVKRIINEITGDEKHRLFAKG